MATNHIKPFAASSSADVVSQAEYEALPDLSSGFPTGMLPRHKLNKVLKQASLIAAAVAQTVADNGADVSDDMTPGDIAALLKTAILAGAGSAAGLAADLASASAGKGAALIGLHDSADYYPSGGVEPAMSMVGEYLRRRCNPKMHPWGAKFDGSTDDTAAINACFSYAAANGLVVELPPGVAIVTNLLYGTQSTSSQSTSPAGLIGSATGATRLKAKAGTTGTVLKAWSIAGSQWSGFTVDCNSQSGVVGIDTTWKPGVGPSLQNTFQNVWVENYAATGWIADNNNDTTFLKCMVRSPTTTTQVAFRIRAPGGMVTMRDCTWSSGLLDISGQNIELASCWGHGIRFAAGGTNAVVMNGCYLYSSDITLSIISTENVAPGTKIQSLEFNGGLIDCTVGRSVVNARIASGIRFNGCAFSPSEITTSVLLLGAGCTRDLGNGRVMIDLANCRAEYNFTAGAPLVIDFTAPFGFTVNRMSYDAAGTQINDSGTVIKYRTTLGAITNGSWYPLTSGGELTAGLWALDVLWTIPGAAPYYVSGAALVRTLTTNAGSAGPAISVNCDTHAHGGALIAIRPAANTTNGPSDFEWSPTAAAAAGSTLEVTCVKLC